MQKLKVKTKKFIVLALVLVFVLPLSIPQKAEAQWAVFDAANFGVNTDTAVNTSLIAVDTTMLSAKEYGLDAVLYGIINGVIEELAAKTVDWINKGFKGDPLYVTNPNAYFTELANDVAGQYIFSDPNLNFLCSPIEARIRIALNRAYINEPNWQCTLTEVGEGMEDFMDDFGAGGWDSFFEITQNQHMNPIGAYIQAENELAQRLENQINQKTQQLDWGQGFLSYTTCDDEDRLEAPPILNPDGTMSPNSEPGPCIAGREKIETPGSVIQTQLNDVLNIGNQRLAVADEIDEIISALLNQLIKRVVGGITGGLRGLSQKDSTDNNRVFTDRLATGDTTGTNYSYGRDSIDDYINQSQQDLDDYLLLMYCRNNPSDPACVGPGGVGPGDGTTGEGSSYSIVSADQCTWFYAEDLKSLIIDAGLPVSTLIKCSPNCVPPNGASCLIEQCDPATDASCAGSSIKIKPRDNDCDNIDQYLLLQAAQMSYEPTRDGALVDYIYQWDCSPTGIH